MSYLLFLIVLSCCVVSKKADKIKRERWEKVGDVALELLNDYQTMQSGIFKKKIILKPLLFNIPIDKYYFSEEEAKKFLTEHNMVNELKKFDSVIRNSFDEQQNLIVTDFDKSIVGSETNKISKGNFLLFFCRGDKCGHGDSSILSNVFCFQEIATAINHDIYGVRDSLEDLIFSINYTEHKNDSTIIPRFLMQQLDAALEETKNSLPDTLKIKVANYSISLSPKKRYLWVTSDSKHIFISPYLIRAAFILTMNKYQNILHWYSPLKYGETTMFELGASVDTVEKYNSIMLTDFKQCFQFAFGHELAHHYLTGCNGSDDYAELVCDCNSWKYLHESKVSNTLGIYESMLQSSLKSKNDSLWGIKDKNGIKTRFYYMEQLMQAETLDCTPR